MTVILTGCAGYIGSHTCVALLRAGVDVVGVDNFSNSRPEAVERIRSISGHAFVCYEADLLDREAIEQIFRKHHISAVIHFAGFKAVGESMTNPLAYYDNNVTGTLRLLEIMMRHNVKRIVFSSSCTVYGRAGLPPYRETDVLNPACPYGSTKLVIEKVLCDICKSDDCWSVLLLRYFNPIGAHESGLLGEDPNGVPNSLVPFLAKVALGALPELNIFGGDYCTADGTPVRDYVHVMDIADGHVNALRYCFEHVGVEAVNLGRGEGYSVMQVVHSFEKASGVKVNYRIVARRPGDVAVSYADPSKAHVLLRWRARLDLDRMCADAWRFGVQNLRDFEPGRRTLR